MSKTIKEMCETIVRADMLRKPDGTAPTAEEVFSYSPTGELSQVFYWYMTASTLLGENEYDYTQTDSMGNFKKIHRT